MNTYAPPRFSKLRTNDLKVFNNANIGGHAIVNGTVFATNAEIINNLTSGISIPSLVKYPVSYSTTTITTAAIKSGFLHLTGGSGDISLPSTSSLLTELGSPETDSYFKFTIFNNSLNKINIVNADADTTIYGGTEILPNDSDSYTIRVLSSTTIRFFSKNKGSQHYSTHNLTTGSTLTAGEFNKGMVDVTTGTGSTLTTDTGTQMALQINTSVEGDSIECLIVNSTGSALTIAAGTDITLVGNGFTTIPNGAVKRLIYVQSFPTTTGFVLMPE